MNYSEFYSMLSKMPGGTDGLKEELVLQFTNGRTESLREMSEKEFDTMLASMRKSTGMSDAVFTAEIKRRRSAVLKRMQKIGVDTTVWANVDHFCLSPKIAGKRFAKLTLEELADLIPKLEKIMRKGEHRQIPGDLLNVGHMSWN